MSNFLDVDESLMARKLILNGINQESGIGCGIPEPKLLTPTDRLEQSHIKFIIPQPGVCVKTRDTATNHKVFVNICKSDDIQEPLFNLSDEEMASILENGSDEETKEIRIPMSIGDKHIEKDKSGNPCPVFDVIINSKYFEEKFLKSDLHRTFLIVVMLEGIDEKFKLDLDKNNYNILQQKKCFGKLNHQLIKDKPGIQEVKSTQRTPFTMNKTSPLVEEICTKELELDCKITQVSRDLAVAEVKIPNLRNFKQLKVTLGADRIIVDSPVGQLDVFVGLDIHQEESKAEYNVDTELLTLHLALMDKP